MHLILNKIGKSILNFYRMPKRNKFFFSIRELNPGPRMLEF